MADSIFEDDEGNEDGHEVVTLEGWESFGVLLKNPQAHIMKTIETVGDMMQELLDEDKIEQWFFLYEGDFIAIRYERGDYTKKELQKIVKSKLKKFKLKAQPDSFASYKEKKGKLFNEDTVEAFVEIMCWTTELWMTKRKFRTNFSNYRFMERVSHCMFNVLCGGFIHGIKDEKYFLHQRILERSKSIFDDEFEDSCIPDVKLKKYYS